MTTIKKQFYPSKGYFLYFEIGVRMKCQHTTSPVIGKEGEMAPLDAIQMNYVRPRDH